ncbi:hypothetical protein DRQ33_05295 [bacterium]|nr:MAG: hypothetical protein DRQ33_05295 [bacterium]
MNGRKKRFILTYTQKNIEESDIFDAISMIGKHGRDAFPVARKKLLKSVLGSHRRFMLYKLLWWLPFIFNSNPPIQKWEKIAMDMPAKSLVESILGMIISRERGNSHKQIFSESQINNAVKFLRNYTMGIPILFRMRIRDKNNINELIITIGVAGSGKSKFIQQKYSHYERISMDRVRGIYSLDPADPEQSQLAYRYCIPQLEKVLAQGKSAIWDATSLTQSSRKGILTLARKYNAKVITIFFDIPIDEVKRRNRSRRRVVPENVIDEQNAKLEPPHIWETDEIIIVDKNWRENENEGNIEGTG